MDLPLNEVLGAVVQAAGDALLDGIGTDIPGTISNDPVPDFTTGASAAHKELQGTAYKYVCEFMRKAEPTRRKSVCIPCHRPSTPPMPPTVNWKDSMVQVRNGQGGWAWILKKNEGAYLAEQGTTSISVEARPPTS